MSSARAAEAQRLLKLQKDRRFLELKDWALAGGGGWLVGVGVGWVGGGGKMVERGRLG